MRDYFLEYWQKRNDAGHRLSTEDWFEKNATELLHLFPAKGVLLDVGCGNAEILAYLAPHFESAIGIDFSSSMLNAARRRLDAKPLPNVNLMLADACDIPIGNQKTDLILSYQVAQNLDDAQLRRHLRECRRILRQGGIVGVCSVPWANLRHLRECGGLTGPRISPAGLLLRYCTRAPRGLYHRLKLGVMSNGIGFWYTHEEMKSIAASEGFECEIVNSWYYEYRFHAILRVR
jgi:ubiquinone/menaquinone biosynthesis C-methylase UbiE